MNLKKKLCTDTVYAVAYRRLGDGDTHLYESSVQEEFQLINTSWRYWYADPILFTKDGQTWLFVEKMDRITRKGIISVAAINNHGIGQFTDVLEEEFHLSYPMVFEKNGKIYMIPETADAQKVILYECENFPYKWIPKTILFDKVRYVDTTVFLHNGLWYLVTCEMDKKNGAKTKMLAFHADSIENGLLQPLDNNENTKFRFDVRGGGNPFKINGITMRPVQCGDANNYGKSLKILSFTVEKNRYVEKETGNININKIGVNQTLNIQGTHTYGLENNMEVVDLKILVKANVFVQIKKIWRKLRRE